MSSTHPGLVAPLTPVVRLVSLGIPHDSCLEARLSSSRLTPSGEMCNLHPTNLPTDQSVGSRMEEEIEGAGGRNRVAEPACPTSEKTADPAHDALRRRRVAVKQTAWAHLPDTPAASR